MRHHPDKSVEYGEDGVCYPLDKHNPPRFRKRIQVAYQPKTTCFYTSNAPIPNHEPDIYRILQEQQILKKKHPNIVHVYSAYDDFVDIELVRPLDVVSVETIRKMRDVMEYLHGLGIAYIDWKPDNIGIGDDGEVKLFDFDGSGVFDTCDRYTWILKAPPMYMYRTCKDMMRRKGMKYYRVPDIDHWAFNVGLAGGQSYGLQCV